MASFALRESLVPLTGGALLVLAKGPAGVRDRVLDAIPWLKDARNAAIAVLTLRTLFGFGLATRLSQLLDIWAAQHWCFRRPNTPWDFSGSTEIAVVTGGSSGFGLQMAKKLSSKCKVVVLDIQQPPKELMSLSDVQFYKCDLSSWPAIHETAEAIRRDIGDPSILINNAGVAKPQTILQEDEKFLELLFKVNVLSHFILVKEFLPAMLKQKRGHVVTTASVGSYISGPPLVDYSASKAAVLSFHEGLNAELRRLYAPNGKCIQTTIVHPSVHATGMLKELQATLRAAGGTPDPPSNVANAVVRQILSGRGRQIFVPGSWWKVKMIRSLPVWTQEFLKDAGIGAN